MPQVDDDVYRVLGVSPDADAETVKAAYRAIAHENHPDRRPGDAAAAAKFQAASHAYAQWMQANGERPAQAAPGQAAGFSNIEDIFSQFQDLFGDFFGAARTQPRDRGADLRLDLELTENEAIVGCKRDIEVNRGRVCTDCAGVGGFGEPTTCKDCAGTGKQNMQQGFFMVQTTCAACRGHGKRWAKPCACERGLVRRAEKLAVVVPAGIQHGQILRLAGKGDELAGKPTGYLYVAISIEGYETPGTAPPNGTPRDRGNDVVVDAAVRARHLWFGGTLEVPTPDGSATVKVPRNIEDGHEIRLARRGKALAARSGEGGDPYRDVARGDLVVVLRVTPAVQKRREAVGFAALASIVIAILVAVSHVV
ncbi:MAG TPA: DnaJ C-terminal domain-containing protein [Kofleriaceae bacterium]|nr:DnaJ C-terminal domain-containing protein [Kofleriaceae bacterium]